MRNYIDSFLDYMKIEKIASPSAIYDYNKELRKFLIFYLLKIFWTHKCKQKSVDACRVNVNETV